MKHVSRLDFKTLMGISESQEEVVEDLGPKVMKFTFGPDQIMVLMLKDRLKILQRYWDEHGEGLNVGEVIKLMLKEISTTDDDERYELMYGTQQLFYEVDINGDGNLDWGEFMQYIIDAVDGTTIKSDQNETVLEQLEQMKALKYRRFQHSFEPLDKSKHENDIIQTVDCPKHQQVLAIERYGREFKIYDYKMKIQKRMKVNFAKEGFVQSIAFDEKNMLYGIAGSDSHLYFFKKGKIKFEQFPPVKTPCIQNKIWYLKEKKMWISAGSDFKMREWFIEKNGTTRLLRTFVDQTHYQHFNWHTDTITDCIDIYSPNCIATSSLDGTIILYDLINNDIIRTISEQHEKGIRRLRYQRQNGNTMASIGSEIFVNIWQPESLISDIHIGRLNGHKVSIVDGNYLEKAPFFVTIDIHNIIIFWDIKTLGAMQTVRPPMKKMSIGLQVMDATKLWIFSKRFMQIDNNIFDQDEDNDPQSDSILSHPIHIVLNTYTLQQLVVTKKELKMYDAMTGKLESILGNIFKNENESKIEITAFKIDKRNRKAYIANNKGEILVINSQNGVILKNVTQFMEDARNIEMYTTDDLSNSITSLGSSNYKSDSEIDNNEIYRDTPVKKQKEIEQLLEKEDKAQAREDRQNVKFIEKENKNFQQLQLDKDTKKPRQEDEESDEQVENQVTSIDNPEIFDIQLIWEEEDQMDMMICANKKEFFVWDESGEENSKMLRRVSGGHNEDITMLAYDHHLSMVATGCINGEITLYDFELSRVEGILHGHQGDITSLNFLSPYPILISSSMDCTVCVWGVRPCPEKLINVCIKRFQNLSWVNDRDVPTIVTKLKVWKDTMKGIRMYRRQREKMLPASAYRVYEHNFAFSCDTVDNIFKTEFKPNRLSYLPDPPYEEIFQMVIGGQTYQELLRDEISDVFITQGEVTMKSYNDGIDEVKDRVFVFIGDEQGYLKVWDFTSVIEKSGIRKIKPLRETKSAFNPFRLEKVNCSDLAAQVRKIKRKPLPPLLEPGTIAMQVREVKAHDEVISCIEFIDLNDFKGLITCSSDLKVRNWNFSLDLLGSINMKTEKIDDKWTFKTRKLIEKREHNIKELEEIIGEFNDSELFLKGPRRKLIIDENYKEEKKEEKKIERSNWLTIQLERDRHEKKLEEENQKWIHGIEMEQLRTKLISDKIESITVEQDVKFQALKMDMAKKMSDYPDDIEGFDGLKSARDLQIEVNKLHGQLIIHDHKILEESSLRKKLSNKSLSYSASNKKEQFKKSRAITLAIVKTVPDDIGKSSRIGDKSSRIGDKSSRIGDKSPLLSNLGASTKDLSNVRSKETLPSITNRQSIKEIVEHQNVKQRNVEVFKASKVDKTKIVENATLPSLRKQLESITRKPKHRFQQSSDIDDLRKQYKSLVANSKFKTTRNNNHTRPFSINDSEIQILDDFGQGMGIGTEDWMQSRASIATTVNKGFDKLKIQFKQPNSGRITGEYLPPFLENQNRIGGGIIQQTRTVSPTLMSGEDDGDYIDQFNKAQNQTLDNTVKMQVKNLNIKIPNFAQNGVGIPKVISRNPNSSSPERFKSTVLQSTASKLILEKTKKKKDYMTRSDVYSINPTQPDISHLKSMQVDLQNMFANDLQPRRKANILKTNPFQSESMPQIIIRNNSVRNRKDSMQSVTVEDLAHMNSQKSIIDSKKQFDSIKEKYCGKSPDLVVEHLRSKQNLQEIRTNYANLKKSYRLKTVKEAL